LNNSARKNGVLVCAIAAAGRQLLERDNYTACAFSKGPAVLQLELRREAACVNKMARERQSIDQHCLSVRPEGSCARNRQVRCESLPAMAGRSTAILECRRGRFSHPAQNSLPATGKRNASS